MRLLVGGWRRMLRSPFWYRRIHAATARSMALVSAILSPILLFVCLAFGGLGIALALPRRGVSPQLLGAVIAGLAFGVVFVVLGIRAAQAEQLPNLYFYIFALIAVGSALRVITHPRPVYSALYFILTILSSSALYLIMRAEFMAFALIIIYAGAILITYLFVIMLATQAPTEEHPEAVPEYDAYSRDPVLGTVAGVLVLVMLSFMLARGVGTLAPNEAARTPTDLLAQLPGKIVRSLDRERYFRGLEKPPLGEVQDRLDLSDRTIALTITDADRFRSALGEPGFAERFVGFSAPERLERIAAIEPGGAEIIGVAEFEIVFTPADVADGRAVLARLPHDLDVTNVEGVGFALIAGHPMALELAGVILLMAMMGAVVLARKQIELSEDEKAAAAAAHSHGLLPSNEEVA